MRPMAAQRLSPLDRLYKFTDRPMTWTRAIILGFVIYVVAILLLGQVPSLIIYKADEYIATLIEWSAKLPLVPEEGLNPKQIQIIRDIVANGVQMGILTVMLIGAYFYQEGKRKRTGGKGLQDTVKGYMSGK
jgi:Na+/H+ antiporter NhaC